MNVVGLKAQRYQVCICLLAVSILVLENIALAGCIDMFQDAHQGRGGGLPSSCLWVVGIGQYTVMIDVIGAIILFCIGIWKRKSEKAFALICLIFLGLWSASVATCVWILAKTIV